MRTVVSRSMPRHRDRPAGSEEPALPAEPTPPAPASRRERVARDRAAQGVTQPTGRRRTTSRRGAGPDAATPGTAESRAASRGTAGPRITGPRSAGPRIAASRARGSRSAAVDAPDPRTAGLPPAPRRVSRRRAWALLAAGTVALAVAGRPVLSGWDAADVDTARLLTAGDVVTSPEPPAVVGEDPAAAVLGSAVATVAPERRSSEPAPESRPESAGEGEGTGLRLPRRSGLPWASGVYIPGSSREKIDQFASFRGRPIDVVVDWSARGTWDDIVNPTWLYDAWQGTPYTKVFGVAPIPEDGTGDLYSCAGGAYDDKWRQFGTNIKARGLAGQSIIRLGWEFNGNWYNWAAYDPATYAACFRRVVSAAESTAPELRWDWNVNRGRGQSVTDARAAYPGDEYVDVVGIDSYDMWPGVTDEASWAEHLDGEFGLRFWVDFAREHGKKVSVPEWGVYPGTGQAGANGGDNPFYVTKMHEFFKGLGADLAYESYFNEDQSYYAGSLFGPNQNPAASDTYVSLF